jgi:hypothetical protein
MTARQAQSARAAGSLPEADILAQPAQPLVAPEHDMSVMQEVARTMYLGRRGRGGCFDRPREIDDRFKPAVV